jgi:membrane protease YdiL (CAAX protease family)
VSDTAAVEDRPTDAGEAGVVRWGIGTAISSLALAFLIYLVGDTLLVFVAPTLYDRHAILFSIASYQALGLGVATCVVWLLVLRLGVRLPSIGFREPTLPAFLTAVFSLVPIFVGVALVSAAFAAFFPSYHLQGNAQQELPVGNHVSTVKAIVIVLWASIEAPLVEETLFRGIIFQGIVSFARNHFGRQTSVAIGAVISGSLFGLAHFEPHTLPILVFLGIALAYVFYYTRTLYASMLVHGVVNAIAAISVMHGL